MIELPNKINKYKGYFMNYKNYKELLESNLSLNERTIQEYFEGNFNRYGFSEIKQIARNGDFIAWKGKRKFVVEIEKEKSSFKIHNHDISKIDFVIFLTDDGTLNLPKDKEIKIDEKHFFEWFENSYKEKLSDEQQKITDLTLTSKIAFNSADERLYIPIPEEIEGIFLPETIIEIRIKKLTSPNNKKVF